MSEVMTGSLSDRIRELLSDPFTSLHLSDGVIGRDLGCSASTVRKIRMEVRATQAEQENERLRADNIVLANEVKALALKVEQYQSIAGESPECSPPTSAAKAATRGRRTKHSPDQPMFPALD